MTDRSADNPASLDRFLAAQQAIHDQALRELVRGAKRSHWMWFIFPQLRGLGRSPTAHFYGIEDRAEAARYLDHPVLGPRLTTCTEAMLAHDGLTAQQIFGPVDAVKLRSSATLFAMAGPGPFPRVIRRFFDGVPCPDTLRRLDAAWPPAP